MSPYADYDSLEDSSVSARTQAFKRVVLDRLQTGLKINQLPEVLADALDSERYEMAEGLAQAAEDFRRNPQLGLFAPGPRL